MYLVLILLIITLLSLLGCGASASISVLDDPTKLFAVVGGSNCAEGLPYGPQDLTIGGTTGFWNYRHYFSTKVGSVPHDTWLQVVTSDGTNELFRIYWSFRSRMTVTERLVSAVNGGESVSYRVVSPDGSERIYEGYWRFSDAAFITPAKFENVENTRCCLSYKAGVWGAGSGTINGNSGSVQYSFSGIGNWGTNRNNNGDFNCKKVYKNGNLIVTNDNSKSYMYFDTFQQPTLTPTFAPTDIPETSFVSLKASQILEGATYEDYLADVSGFTSVLSSAIADCIPGINATDVQNLIISPKLARRKLQMLTQASNRTITATATENTVDNGKTALRARDQPSSQGTLAGVSILEYYVTVPTSRGLKYSQLAGDLLRNVRNQQFTSHLWRISQEQNVRALVNAWSYSISVVNLSTDKEKEEKPWFQSAGAIAGLTIGSIAALGFVVFGVFFCATRTSEKQRPGPAFDNQSIFVGSSYAVATVENKQSVALSGSPEGGGVASYTAVDTGVELPEMPAAHCAYVVSSPPQSAPPTTSSFTLFGRADNSRW